MEDPIYRKLMDHAMRALGRRAHSEKEIREKLKQKIKKLKKTKKIEEEKEEEEKEFEEKIISRLKELELLDDEDLIRRTIDDAVNFNYQGKIKVIQKLRNKGIPREKIQKIWDDAGIEEKELALKALERAEKRFINTPERKLYHKKLQFLANKGFSAEIAFETAKSHKNLR